MRIKDIGLAAATVGIAAAVGAGIAGATTPGEDPKTQMTGQALARASAVTQTEVADEESRYEGDATLGDGSTRTSRSSVATPTTHRVHPTMPTERH
jgi:hypothetical protein